MIRLDKIYTRKGDKGLTKLGDAQSVHKTSQRIAAIGAVDELNTTLGITSVHVLNHTIAHAQKMHTQILNIQNDLFDLGADLAVPTDSNVPAIRIEQIQVDRLEKEIDAMNEKLAPLDSFVIPGGSNLVSASLHLSRTICRRAEREILRLAQEENINEFLRKFINRLSDHIFVMSRFCITKDCVENLWKPKKNQQ